MEWDGTGLWQDWGQAHPSIHSFIERMNELRDEATRAPRRLLSLDTTHSE